ncbi:MAG: ChaN family lipoprotein [Phycisphaerales bacterium]
MRSIQQLIKAASCMTAMTIFFSGCSTAQKSNTAEPVLVPIEAQPGFDDGHDARALTITTPTGTTTFDSMIAELSTADVILVGEMHNHTPSLDFIATTFEALAPLNPQLVLSMEFYERDEQIALDDYLAGITTYEQFLKASNRSDSNNPIDHLRMVELSKQLSRPIIASNAPRRYTRLARTDGYEALQALTHAQRSMFSIPSTLPTGYYADRFRDAMGAMAAHGGDEMINSFLRSQSLWDQTMADSITDHIRSSGADVFHVVGHFHADYAPIQGGSAMADTIRATMGSGITIRTLVMHELPTPDAQPNAELDAAPYADQASASADPEPGPAADFIVYFPPVQQ